MNIEFPRVWLCPALQLAGSCCSGGLMAAPLRAPLVDLLELERQCYKWCATSKSSIKKSNTQTCNVLMPGGPALCRVAELELDCQCEK